MALNAQIQLSILAHETSSGDISRTLRATPVSYALSLADGTGANQAQVVWSDSHAIPAGGDYSPSGVGFASFQDDRGTVSFSSVKAFYLRNTGSVSLTIEGDAWPELGLGASAAVHPGATLFFARPDAAGFATAGRVLTISNLSGSAGSVDIVLIGEGSVA